MDFYNLYHYSEGIKICSYFKTLKSLKATLRVMYNLDDKAIKSFIKEVKTNNIGWKDGTKFNGEAVFLTMAIETAY